MSRWGKMIVRNTYFKKKNGKIVIIIILIRKVVEIVQWKQEKFLLKKDISGKVQLDFTERLKTDYSSVYIFSLFFPFYYIINQEYDIQVNAE